MQLLSLLNVIIIPKTICSQLLLRNVNLEDQLLDIKKQNQITSSKMLRCFRVSRINVYSYPSSLMGQEKTIV
jgi:hypothetical protein